jgi:hypothetical protein
MSWHLDKKIKLFTRTRLFNKKYHAKEKKFKFERDLSKLRHITNAIKQIIETYYTA